MSSLTSAIKSAERSLSSAAAIPFFGTIPAALKILMGAVELAVATIFVLLALLACCFKAARDSLNEGCNHMKNGFKNILVGSCEAIPFLGTLLYFGSCCLEITGNAAQGAVQGAAEFTKKNDNPSLSVIGALFAGTLGAVDGVAGKG